MTVHQYRDPAHRNRTWFCCYCCRKLYNSPVTQDGNVIECRDLRVVFEWHGDRFGHFIQRHMLGRWITVLGSLEGTPNDEWPLSPPLQTLHIEERPDGPVALLIGRAGSSHWSTSILALTDRGGFLFDLACRAQVRPVQLVATYRAWANRWRSPRNQAAPNLLISQPVPRRTCGLAP